MGTWVMQSRSPSVIRLIANAGFDFVFIDTEHSDFSTETVHTFCDVARSSDLVPIVRAYDTNAHLANRIQDLGAMGLMYHDVTRRDDVERIEFGRKTAGKDIKIMVDANQVFTRAEAIRQLIALGLRAKD